MKHKRIAAAVGVTGGLSYLAYKRISSQLFSNAFSKHPKEDEVDQKISGLAFIIKCHAGKDYLF